MILEGILNVLFSAADSLFSILPDISWNVDSGVFTAFFDILRMVGYLLPMPTVIAILRIIIVINGFKIGVSIVKTIWDLIPFL